MKKTVKTRFAPSPTGALHIGGARTALFNYLYAQHCGGEYYVRIEDTDQSRSTEENKTLIKDGLEWLGLNPASPWVLQSENIDKHKSAIEKLLEEGKAYRCFCSKEELAEVREQQISNKETAHYNGKCRNLDLDNSNSAESSIRIKLPTEGTTAWDDAVQGRIEIQNSTLDDFIIARSDGTPTYNFVVAMDDAEMGITHVIRGDDHINNTPKQIHVYQALGLDVPTFAHVPLIHGKNGKMSKRDGATSVIEYRDMGYLPEAVNNYLMKLGWSLGDEEVISQELAIEKFDICDVNKGASIFDMEKLDWLNGQYLKETSNARLVELLEPFFIELGFNYVPERKDRLKRSLTEAKCKAKTLVELAEITKYQLTDAKYTGYLTLAEWERAGILYNVLSELDVWTPDSIKQTLNNFTQTSEYTFKDFANLLKQLITGTNPSASLTSVLYSYNREYVLKILSFYT